MKIDFSSVYQLPIKCIQRIGIPALNGEKNEQKRHLWLHPAQSEKKKAEAPGVAALWI